MDLEELQPFEMFSPRVHLLILRPLIVVFVENLLAHVHTVANNVFGTYSLSEYMIAPFRNG